MKTTIDPTGAYSAGQGLGNVFKALAMGGQVRQDAADMAGLRAAQTYAQTMAGNKYGAEAEGHQMTNDARTREIDGSLPVYLQHALKIFQSTGDTNAERVANAAKSFQAQGFKDLAAQNLGDIDRLNKLNTLTQDGATYMPVVNVGNTGVSLDKATGKQVVAERGLNALFNNVQRSIANENNAQAGNAAASAALHRAQIPEVQARTELTRSKIGKGEVTTLPDGTVIESGAMPKLTELQGKAQLFGSRAAEADRILTELTGKYSPAAVNLKQSAADMWGIGGLLGAAGNKMISPEAQKAEQAQRDFINAILRLESGAAIGKDEFDNARKQYFPQPGDSEDVVSQKASNRQKAIQGLKIMAGPVAGLVRPSSPVQHTGGQDRLKIMQEAKAALEAGAPREAVIKRLKEMGITEGAL